MIFIFSGSNPRTCPVRDSRKVVRLKLKTTPNPKNNGPKRLLFRDEDATNGISGKIQGDINVRTPAKKALKYKPSLIYNLTFLTNRSR